MTRGFNNTDLGNAERLVDRYGDELRYVPQWGKWLVWDGHRWAPDDTGQIYQRAKLTIRAVFHDCAALDDATERKRLAAWALRSESNAAIKSMIAAAQSEPGIPVTPTQLDARPWLLACANGTLDLRTGELLAHDPEHLITKLVPVAFDVDAKAPRWHAFLERVLDGREDLITFLQRAVGYSLTGLTSEQCLFFLYGTGANGKSTFLDVLQELAGENAIVADFTSFIETKNDGPRNDIARLVGSRLVTSSELGEGKRLNEALVKKLTGNDAITARFLHQENFTFTPQFKLWLAGNHKPVIRGTDHAIWRRIRLVPFTVQIPEEEQDEGLKDALRAELPGILTWAVRGCRWWQEDGLRAPAIVLEATEKYRRDSDRLASFLEDECYVIRDEEHLELKERSKEPSSKLYAAYKRWCDDNGEHAITGTAFGLKLEELGHPVYKNGLKYRVGLKLRDVQPTLSPSFSGGFGGRTVRD